MSEINKNNEKNKQQNVGHQKPTNPKKYYCKIVYLKPNGDLGENFMPLEQYNESDNYKSNLEDAWACIVDESGCWIDEDTILPLHRIVAFKAVREKPQQNSPKNPGPPRSKRRRPPRQKPNTDNSLK